MIWRFLTVENIIALQAEQIDLYGGSHGLRDFGLLESAVSRAKNKVNYEPDATVPQVAASLSWGLVKNHAFIDGNKRIGLVSLIVFLGANGYRSVKSPMEESAMVLRAAASEITEDEWTAWVERSVAPLA
ncbi:death on curing protein [Granulicella rosea]|uniref:Death on curing protein n=1 Tax=Granulicella rosea TaxID=474952 RepID=A0A239DJ51_9BACT|nr:type II toxin-antitoxin system death-on-curing family toxin [Granulicella rosea]SNS32427.1 death on curing protein [Granulicella rosea]